jgi:hypothetical protein
LTTINLFKDKVVIRYEIIITSQSRKLEIITEKSTSGKVAAAFLAICASVIRLDIIVF